MILVVASKYIIPVTGEGGATVRTGIVYVSDTVKVFIKDSSEFVIPFIVVSSLTAVVILFNVNIVKVPSVLSVLSETVVDIILNSDISMFVKSNSDVNKCFRHLEIFSVYAF